MGLAGRRGSGADMSEGGITGDFGELDKAIAAMEGLSSFGVDVADNAAKRITTIARADYAAGRGPNGEEWPRRKSDGAIALQRPAAAISFVPLGETIQGVAEAVLAYHQEGSDRLPKRKVFPDPGEAMPASWEKAIEDAAKEEMAKRAPK